MKNNKNSRQIQEVHKLSPTKAKQIKNTVINNESVPDSISPFEKSNEITVDQPSTFDVQNYHSRRSTNESPGIAKSVNTSINNGGSKLPQKIKNADMPGQIGEVHEKLSTHHKKSDKELSSKNRNYLRNYESTYSFQKSGTKFIAQVPRGILKIPTEGILKNRKSDKNQDIHHVSRGYSKGKSPLNQTSNDPTMQNTMENSLYANIDTSNVKSAESLDVFIKSKKVPKFGKSVLSVYAEDQGASIKKEQKLYTLGQLSHHRKMQPFQNSQIDWKSKYMARKDQREQQQELTNGWQKSSLTNRTSASMGKMPTADYVTKTMPQTQESKLRAGNYTSQGIGAMNMGNKDFREWTSQTILTNYDSQFKDQTALKMARSIQNCKVILPVLSGQDLGLGGVIQNKITGNIQSNKVPEYVNHEGGMSGYNMHMKDLRDYKKTERMMKRNLADKLDGYDTLDQYHSSNNVSEQQMSHRQLNKAASVKNNNTRKAQSRSSALRDLELYKNAQSKILHSTFLTQQKNFRSPDKQPTFGNPLVQDKYCRKVICRETMKEAFGKNSPGPARYYGDVVSSKPLSTFYTEPHKNKSIGRETKHYDKIFLTRHMKSISNINPQSYQNRQSMKSEYRSGFAQTNNGREFGSKAARQIDVRCYAQLNHVTIAKGLM